MLDIFSKWKDKITHYLDVRIKLLKLNFIGKTSGLLSYLIFVFLLLFLLLAVLIFLGIGLSEWFAALTDSRVGGYLMTSGVYLILVFILMGLRKTLIGAFSGIFIRMLTQDDDGNSEEKSGEEKI